MNKIFICHTFYHINQSLIELNETNSSGSFYLCDLWTKFPQEFIDNLTKLECVDIVEIFNYEKLNYNTMTNWTLGSGDLKKQQQIYEKTMEEIFQKSDIKNSDIYIYAPERTENFYLFLNGKTIVKMEDSYKSYDLELQKEPSYQEKFFTEMLNLTYLEINSTPRLRKIVVSDTSKVQENIIKVDFYDRMKHLNKEVLEDLYNLNAINLLENSVMFLTQPIFADLADQKLFFYFLIENYKQEYNDIYIKAHPADNFDYSMFENVNIHILPTYFPIEVLNVTNTSIDSLETYYSTALDLCTFAKNKKTFKDLKEKFTINDVRQEIYQKNKQKLSEMPLDKAQNIIQKLNINSEKYSVKRKKTLGKFFRR